MLCLCQQLCAVGFVRPSSAIGAQSLVSHSLNPWSNPSPSGALCNSPATTFLYSLDASVHRWSLSGESNPLPFLTAICQVLSKASPCLCSCFFQHYYWMLFLFALRLCCTGPTQTCGCWLAVSLHWALPIAIGLIEMSGRIPSTFVSSLSVGILVSSGRWS